MADTKTERRVRLLRARAAIDAGRREAAAAAIAARLVQLAEFASARTVLLYSAIGAEVDVDAVAGEARRHGKRVYRPASGIPVPAWVVHDTPAERRSPATRDRASTAADDQVTPRPATRGHEPERPPSDTDERPARLAELAFPVMMIVPGVGFDAHGGRLGRGHAYYDQAIAAVRAAGNVAVVGAAYEEQVTDRLPQDPWDQRVDLVVTERRVLVPQPSRRGDSRRREEVRDDV